MEKEKCKLAFIKEDSIEFKGLATPNSQHLVYLLEYIENNYKDHPVLSRLLKSGVTDQIVYGLTYTLHMAVLLNETKFDSNGNVKYGKFACLELPPVITPKLEAQILSLGEFLNNFTQIIFEVSGLDENGFLIGEMLDIDDNLTPIEKASTAISLVREKGENLKR